MYIYQPHNNIIIIIIIIVYLRYRHRQLVLKYYHIYLILITRIYKLINMQHMYNFKVVTILYHLLVQYYHTMDQFHYGYCKYIFNKHKLYHNTHYIHNINSTLMLKLLILLSLTKGYLINRLILLYNIILLTFRISKISSLVK